MRGSLFRRHANPRQADDEEDLGQGEIAQTQIPPQIW